MEESAPSSIHRSVSIPERQSEAQVQRNDKFDRAKLLSAQLTFPAENPLSPPSLSTRRSSASPSNAVAQRPRMGSRYRMHQYQRQQQRPLTDLSTHSVYSQRQQQQRNLANHPNVHQQQSLTHQPNLFQDAPASSTTLRGPSDIVRNLQQISPQHRQPIVRRTPSERIVGGSQPSQQEVQQ